MSAAFSRTRTLLALKEAHPMAMSKWWGKKRHAEAEVTMHLSPYLLNTVSPWIPTFPKKAVDRFATWLWPIGTAAGTYYVLSWADHEDHKEQYHHRY